MDQQYKTSVDKTPVAWLERVQALLAESQEIKETGWRKAHQLLAILHRLSGAQTTVLVQETDAVAARVQLALPKLPPAECIRIHSYQAYLEEKAPRLHEASVELSRMLGASVQKILCIPIDTEHFRDVVIVGFDNTVVTDPNFSLFVLCCQAQLREIIELAHTLQLAQERIQQFYALTRHISQGFVFIDDHSPSVYVNESAARWLGLSAGEHPADQVSERMAALRQKAINQEEITSQIEYAFANPTTPVRDWLWKYFEPELMVLKVSCILISTPELQGKLWLMDEVTHEVTLSEEVAAMNEELVTSNEELISMNENLKATNDQLEERNHFIELVMATMPNSTYIFDLELQENIYINKDVFLSIGYTQEQVAAMPFENAKALIHADDLAAQAVFLNQFATVADKEIRELVFRLRHADGTYRWFLTQGTVFRRNAHNIPTQIICITQDITQLKEAEFALRDTLGQLQHSNEALQTTNTELLLLTEQLKLANRKITTLAREKLKLAEQQYRDLTENMQASFVIFDKHLRYLYVNKAFEKMTGRLREEVVGKRIDEVFPETIAGKINEKLHMVQETGNSVSAHHHLVYGDKRDYVDSSYYPTASGGVFVIIQNVTEKVLNEFRFRDLAESITDPIVMLDEHFRYVYWNNATEQATGKSMADAIGKQPDEVLGQSYYEQYKDRFESYQRVMSSKKPEVVSNTILRNNTYAYVDILVYPTLQGGILAITRDVTARVVAEKNYRELADSITDIFFALDNDLRYVFFNKASENFLGKAAADVLGKTIYEVIPSIKDTPSEQMIRKVLAERTSNTLVNTFQGDGTQIYHRMYFYPTASGVSVFASDITEKIQLTRRLEEEKQQLALALHSGGLGLWDWNVHTGEVYFDEQWLAFLEYMPGELEPSIDTWLAHIHDDDLERVTIIMSDHLNNKTSYYQTEFRLLTKSGQWKWVYDSGKVITRDAEGKPLRATGVTMEITRKKQYELKIEQLNEELEQKVKDRTAQLSAANQELEAFSYSVSHDLRIPLRSIDGFSKALLEDYAEVLNDEGRDYLNTIRSATSKMGQLIEDIMKLARVTRAEMDKEPVNMSQIATHILGELMQDEPSRQVTILVEPDIVALGDEKLLTIVLHNLLLNAWKYTSKTEVARIEVGKQTDRTQEIYFVKDNGVGFDMKRADKLFSPFQRLHSKRDFDGNGIGLATVQRIITKHGGTIWAQATPDQGATFFFTLKETTLPEDTVF
jgi:PAS domain S-box-containing protein